MAPTIEPDVSLAELVIERPRCIPVLELLDLDYCCGGSRSLTEACRANGLDVDDVVGQLIRTAPTEEPDDWAAYSPPELADHVEQVHHAYLRKTLAGLAELMERVLEVHGDRRRELRKVSDAFVELRRDLEPHLMKEEQVLFPMIRELFDSDDTPSFHCGSLQNPIGVMSLEHDRAGELLAQLRRLTSGYSAPGDACASYRALYAGLAELEADTHLHIHKENNVLFPAAVAEERERIVISESSRSNRSPGT